MNKKYLTVCLIFFYHILCGQETPQLQIAKSVYAGLPCSVYLKCVDIESGNYFAVLGEDTLTVLQDGRIDLLVPIKGNKLDLKIFKKNAKGYSLVLQEFIKIKLLPNPIAFISYPEAKKIKKSDLLNCKALNAVLFNLDYEINTPVVRFSMIFYDGKNIIELTSKDKHLTEEQREKMLGLDVGTFLIFNDILVKMPEGERNLGSLIYKIE